MTKNILIFIVICALVAESSTLELNRSKRSVDTCGATKIMTGLIVGGENFPRGSYPWIVALMHQGFKPPRFFCGATLISRAFVVSAAHCILQKYSDKKILPRDILAFFGAHDLDNPYETGRYALSPIEIYIQDRWNPGTTEYDGDLSLLEFEQGSILFNDYIQPICLWNSETEPTVMEGIVTGWGKSEDKTKLHENMPKLIKAPIQSNEDCWLEERKLFGLSSKITFCAGLRNGSGICQGDSGSGFFLKVNEVHYLKGVSSSSLIDENGCDVSRQQIYTNVLKLKNWIESITGPILILPARRSSSCGLPKLPFGLIHHGQSFARGRFPWLVALTYSNLNRTLFICGATLISSNFVLSAAHCIHEKFKLRVLQPQNVIAIFGAHDLTKTDEIGRYELSPENIIIHGDWDFNSTQYDADMSLLIFKKGSIIFNAFVQPICLWNSEKEPIVTEGFVAGWGRSEDPTKRHENVPKMIKTLIKANQECLPGDPDLAKLSSKRTFCAGLKNGSGVCHGDSGGGLYIVVDELFYLKGIVSSSLLTSTGECETTQDAIYTNVFAFTAWLDTENHKNDTTQAGDDDIEPR